MTTTDTYTTTDLSLATALFTSGHSLIGVDKSDPQKASFVFEYGLGLDFVVNDFWSGKLKLSARIYADNLRMMKSRLYR